MLFAMSIAPQGGTSEADYLGGAAMGEDGSSVFAGHTRGNWSGTNAGGLDWAAMKLSAEGEEVWRWQSGTADDDKFHSISMHQDGSVYLSGTTANSTSGTDFAVFHLDSDGRELWAFQDSTDGRDTAHYVAVGNDGRVVVAGFTSGAWGKTSAGLYDFAAFGLDADGSLLWKYQDGTDGDDLLWGVAVHDDNTIVVVGYTEGDFGAVNAGGNDVVAIKLSETGEELWRFQAGGADRDSYKEVVIGDDGSIILAGSTQGDWLEGLENGQEDFAAAKLSADGEEIWRYQGGTTEADEVYGATATEDGSVILSGTTDGSWDGDNAGAVDLILVKLSPEGEELWRWQGGTAGDDIAWDMGANHLADGRMVLAGYSDGDWTGGTIDGSDDFLVVMVNTTVVSDAPPTAVTTTALSLSSSSATALTVVVVAVVATCAVAVCLLLKRRRDWRKKSEFEEAKIDFDERGAPATKSLAAASPTRKQVLPPPNPRPRRWHQISGWSTAEPGRQHPGVGLPGSSHTSGSSKPGEDHSDPSLLPPPPPPAHDLRRETTGPLSLSGSGRDQAGSAAAAAAPAAADHAAATTAQGKTGSSNRVRASEKEEKEEESAAEEAGLKQPFEGVGIALSVLEGALTLAEQCPIPGVREAAHLVSMLVNMAADSRGNACGGEARIKMCRSVLVTLQRAAEVVVEGGGTSGEERVLIEDVHDAISDLVDLIKTYESKNALLKVLGSSLFKKRQEEADAIIDRAIMRLHLGLQVQVGNKLQQMGKDVKKAMQGRPAASEESNSKILARERRARRRRKLNQLEIPEDQVVITDELLGRGGFGAVYLANYNCRNAAVKVMQITHELGRMDSLDESEAGSVVSWIQRTPRRRREGRQRTAFLRELEAMIRLRSPNTVNVYGAITSRRDRLVLVMELLAGGDLRMFLKNSRGRPLPEGVARRIIADVCAGMVFLHGKATVHGDLKSANVLLDGAGRAKIGDFGTSRWMHRGGENSTGLVTCTARTKPNATQMSLAWSAPEVLEAEGCTYASDVYSFGVVVWEVLAREVPWADKARPRDIICAVLKGLRPTMPADAPADIADMARRCWSGVPGERPSIKEIMEGMRATGET